MTTSPSEIQPIRWRDGALELLDQRVLPGEVRYLTFDDVRAVADAITSMVVRGAPAIGVTAAYGVVLAARGHFAASPARWRERITPDLDYLARSRPTAVNLAWALTRMRAAIAASGPGDPVPGLLDLAERLHREDVEACRRMGDFGAALIEDRCSVLTHCNAGALATAGYGTALGVIRSAHRDGKIEQVLADETRPWLQGARLTAWELVQEGIPVSLIVDSAASYAMAQGHVRWVIVGADRVAANGDVANKIGTYSLAVSARHHGVGFMVAAPLSTIDADCPSGADIPIEQRADAEIVSLGEQRLAPEGVGVWNPVFDVTPAALVDVLVTEHGVIERPDREKIAALFERESGASATD